MQPIDLSAMMPQAQQPLPPVQPAPPRPAPPQSTTRQVTNTTSVVNNVGTTSAANYAGGLYVRFGGPAAPPQEPGPPPRLQSFEKLQREQQDRDAARHFDAMTKLNMVR